MLYNNFIQTIYLIIANVSNHMIVLPRVVLKEMGLEGTTTPARAGKKWENLKKNLQGMICVSSLHIF